MIAPSSPADTSLRKVLYLAVFRISIAAFFLDQTLDLFCRPALEKARKLRYDDHNFRKENRETMAKITLNFLSHKLRRAVDVTIVLPSMNFQEMMGENPSHKLKAKFPVIYLLHGYGNNHAIWNAYTGVEMFAEERNIAVVMISGENKSYINVETGRENFDIQERYYEFLSEEIPEFVTEYFPISKDPK